jgi:hypothetical protein
MFSSFRRMYVQTDPEEFTGTLLIDMFHTSLLEMVSRRVPAATRSMILRVFASFNIKIHTLRLNSALYFTHRLYELCVLHR